MGSIGLRQCGKEEKPKELTLDERQRKRKGAWI
jgi:hypothetical protein